MSFADAFFHSFAVLLKSAWKFTSCKDSEMNLAFAAQLPQVTATPRAWSARRASASPRTKAGRNSVVICASTARKTSRCASRAWAPTAAASGRSAPSPSAFSDLGAAVHGHIGVVCQRRHLRANGGEERKERLKYGFWYFICYNLVRTEMKQTIQLVDSLLATPFWLVIK